MKDLSSKIPDSAGSRRAAVVIALSIVVYIVLVIYHTAPYNYNLSSLIRIGIADPFFCPPALSKDFVVFNDPKSGGAGYDGQYYYYMINQLLMGGEGIPNPFRFQRILYPLLAYALALGRTSLIPLSMLLVNLLAIAAGAVFLWMMFRETSLRPEYLLLYALNVGFLIAVFYDVATPVCIGLVVAAAYFFSREKLWLASLMIALSLLAQENGVIVLAAFGIWLAWKKNWRGAFILAAAALPWALWQVFLWDRYGDFPFIMSGNHFRAPFAGMISQIASFRLPGGWVENLRELSVYPMMLFVLALLVVSIVGMRKKPGVFMLVLLLHAVVGISFNREQIWSSTITSSARALAGVFPFLVVCYARERTGGLRILVVLSVLLALMGIARILLMPSHPFYIV